MAVGVPPPFDSGLGVDGGAHCKSHELQQQMSCNAPRHSWQTNSLHESPAIDPLNPSPL
jgi:hypothetical protein